MLEGEFLRHCILYGGLVVSDLSHQHDLSFGPNTLAIRAGLPVLVCIYGYQHLKEPGHTGLPTLSSDPSSSARD